MKVTVKAQRKPPGAPLFGRPFVGEIGPMGEDDVWTDRYYVVFVPFVAVSLGLHK